MSTWEDAFREYLDKREYHFQSDVFELIARSWFSAGFEAAEPPRRPEGLSERWMPIDTAPLGQMVLLWGLGWRHPFPGRRNGDYGAVYVDTCEPEAKGWQSFASYWMPLPTLPTAYEPGGKE